MHRIKYEIDIDIFKTIDCEWKAYFLGLLYADGCVSKLFHTILALNEKDVDILNKLNKILYNNKRKLNYRPPFKSKINGKIINNGGVYILKITRSSIGKDLINLGCFQNKSLTLKFPTVKQVPNHLINHFIRGYFDGDGHINKHLFSIIGSKDFTKGCANELETKLEIKCGKQSHAHSPVITIKAHHIKDLRLIYNFLYNDVSIWMNRKRKTFERVLSESYIPSSQYKYICFDKFLKSKPWKVVVRKKQLGRYKTENEAKIVRDKYLSLIKSI